MGRPVLPAQGIDTTLAPSQGSSSPMGIEVTTLPDYGGSLPVKESDALPSFPSYVVEKIDGGKIDWFCIPQAMQFTNITHH